MWEQEGVNRTWPGWCVECQMRLWFVACPLPNKSNAINSLSRSNRAYQARGIPRFPHPFSTQLEAAAVHYVKYLTPALVTRGQPQWKFNFPWKMHWLISYFVCTQNIPVFRKGTFISCKSSQFTWHILSIVHNFPLLFLYFSSPFFLLICWLTRKLSALSLYMYEYCKCIWDCPSLWWCWFWLLCLGCFSFSFSLFYFVSCLFFFTGFSFEFSLLCVVLFRITYIKTFF